jgi:hypothetical protein
MVLCDRHMQLTQQNLQQRSAAHGRFEIPKNQEIHAHEELMNRRPQPIT